MVLKLISGKLQGLVGFNRVGDPVHESDTSMAAVREVDGRKKTDHAICIPHLSSAL